jgi:hypothetical protein
LRARAGGGVEAMFSGVAVDTLEEYRKPIVLGCIASESRLRARAGGGVEAMFSRVAVDTLKHAATKENIASTPPPARSATSTR